MAIATGLIGVRTVNGDPMTEAEVVVLRDMGASGLLVQIVDPLCHDKGVKLGLNADQVSESGGTRYWQHKDGLVTFAW